MYDDVQSMTVIDGGLQTVFPESVLASPATAPSRQLVYLDFDGAVTSYYNRDLDIRIDDIVVENSGFDDATISAIVADLNALYGDDIHFISSMPEEDDTPYSTIYIGVTSAFDEYGSFLGLAETVDVGNQIRDDNAFVLLDSTASPNLVTSVIAHETEHLVGTLDHGGEGVERYAEYIEVSSGQVVTGRVLSDGMTLAVRGTVNNTTILSGGSISLKSGGMANDTTVNSGGHMLVHTSGMANNITVNQGGVLNWAMHGQGAVVLNIVENGGYVALPGYEDKQVTFVPNVINGLILSDCSMTLHSGTTANSTTVSGEFRGIIYIYSGGTANSTTVNSRGEMYVCSDAVANGTTVNSRGEMYVSSGAVANGTTVNSGGRVYVSSGAITNATTVNSSGLMNVCSGAVVNGTTVNSGGFMLVSNGGTAVTITMHSGGILTLCTSSTISGQFDMHGGAKVKVEDGVDATEAEITFHVEVQTEEDDYVLVVYKNLYVGLAGVMAKTYSITVDNEQTAGMYKLAQGAAGFEGEFTLKNTDGDELGTLTINGNAVYAGTYEYALLEEEGNLTLSVGIIGAPSFIDRFAPVLGERLAVTVDGSDAVVEWDAAWDNIGVAGYQFRYSDSRELEGNGTTFGETSISLQDLADGRYFYQIRAFDAAGNFSDWSKIKSFTVGDAPPMYVLYSVPEAEYMYGCTATVVGMLLGYYDRYGYLGHDVSNLIDGIVELNARGLDGNAYDMDAFDTVLGAAIASPEYVAHFVDTTPLQEYPYTFVGDSTTLNTAAWNCIADFIGTGQWWRGNEDLSTTLYSGSLAAIREFAETEHRSYGELSVNVPAKYSDFLYGLDLYVQHAGYQLDAEHTYTMETDNNGGTFTFDDYMAEIDEGRPVIVSLEGHTVLGYGYDASTQEIIFDDTYEHECRMTWGGEYFYSDASRPMESVTIVQFATKKLADYDVHVTKVEEQETESGVLLDWRGDSTTTWADAYEVSLALGNGEITLTGFPIAGVELLNAKYYTVSVSIRPERIDIWTKLGELEIATENLSASPQVVTAEDNELTDVMFGRPTGVWNGIFVARHTELGMSAPLEDKNIIGDIYGGSNDTSLLLLTDDANGDALFVDDFFSAFPDGLEAQARIAKIDEIRAGAGNDVVDLTSQRFAYVGGGMTVHGGLGDDVIWANSGDNWLFGDAGNDKLVGAGGNDVLVGGAGDDTLHGGGGDDLFAFGGDWGNDTVEQLARSKVTLWFQDGDETNVVWNAEASTLTYTDGNNSVTVTGVSKENITLKFGDDGSEQYRDLLAAGAFNEFTSERIFENKGMLA